VRRMTDEGPLIPEQEHSALIDGDAMHDAECVTIMLGKTKKKQAPAPAAKARMPITDMTEQDAGGSFVIGLGGTTGEQQVQPERASSAISPRIPSKGGGKSKRK
jgi:hypothetical protein